MNPGAPGTITGFFHDLRAGHVAAAEGLFEHFFPRLVALARHSLQGRPVAVADAEDAAQSAFISFWQRTGVGGFGEIYSRNELWNLLARITVRKALRAQRRELAAKRGGGGRVNEADLPADAENPANIAELAAARPTEDFDLCCEELLDPLDDELRAIALQRLAGHSNGEIAQLEGCSERRIERKLNLIRLKWAACANP